MTFKEPVLLLRSENMVTLAYMALEEPVPPVILKELLSFSDGDNIPTVIGTDANEHHVVWCSSNVNARGIDLLSYCASANLDFCNVGNKPTFRTRKREQVLDLTLINQNAVNCIRNWHISDVPSFSDHMYIRFSAARLMGENNSVFWHWLHT